MRSPFPRTTVAVRWTCPRLAVRTIVLCVVVSLFSSLVARGETPTPKKRWGVVASGQAKAKRGYVSVRRVENGPGAIEPPVFTDEQRGAVAVARAHERPLLEVPVLAGLQMEDYDQPGPETHLQFPNTAADPQTGQVAGGDIAIWRNSSASGVQQVPECFTPGIPNCVLSPEEPTVGVNRDVLWLSGNAYAAISGDGGITWAYRNPFDFFPADGINDQPAGLFNGDQVVYYSPTHDLMFWYLQYDTVRDANNNQIAANIQRLAWATSREDMLNGIWNFADFSPASFGYSNNTFWLDFPDMAVTDNFLYITTNIFRLDGTGGTTGNIFRISLDQLRAGGGFTFQHYQQHSFRCCHGGTDGMFWAAHIFTSRIRVYRWGDGSDIIAHDDVDHPAYTAGQMVAMGPDGRNAAGRADNRILGAYRNSGELGFMYMSAQHDNFPFPYIDVLKIRESDREYLTTETIWNPNQAWIYPSVHPNDSGAKGGTLAFVGPTQHPGLAVFIVDSKTNHSFSPLNNLYVANGTAGPGGNRWGDYFSSRQNWLDTRTWSGTGYVMTGPNVNNSDPRYVWFGRTEDVPPVDFDINQVQVQPPGGTYGVGQTLNVVANVANGGAQDAIVPLFEFRLSQDENFNVGDPLLDSRTIGLVAGATTQLVANVPVPPIPSGNYLVGALTPLFADAYIGNNFGYDPAPIRVCPGFTEQPATQVVDACGEVTFHAAITPTTTGFVTRQWRWEGINLFDDLFLGGSHTDTLTIGRVYPTDAGTYDIAISDAVCDLLSVPAELTVRPPHVNSITGAGTHVVCEDTILQANISGIPAFTHQWRKNSANLTDDARRTGSTSNALAFDGLRLADTGTYDILVANACADADNTIPTPLTVVPKPWTTVASTGPGARNSQSMAYDSKRGVTIMFGGTPGADALLRETWEWNGNTWTLRSTSGPSARASAGMAYDADRGVCVLFGGSAAHDGNPNAYLNDTWEWDGNSWTQRTTTVTPLQRVAHSMVYDTAAKKIVMHGGWVGFPLYQTLHDTWEFDSVAGTWVQISSGFPNLPPGNYVDVGAMAYDSARNKRYAFNGWIAPDFNWDMHTFEWDGAQWVRIFPANDPVYRNPGAYTGGAGITYHEGRQMVIWNNGAYRLSDPVQVTWSFDGAAWKLLSLSDGPPRSAGGTIAYDSARNAIVQFGGGGPWGMSPPDTWEMVDADEVIIVKHPQSRNLPGGQRATFSAIVRGAPLFTYQWRKNGVNLADGGVVSGATTGSLVISSVGVGHIGSYDVVVSNECGSATSAPAALWVADVARGDFDIDLDIDEDDYAFFWECLRGPNVPSSSPSCGLADLDLDGDVDLADYDVLQRCYSGRDMTADPGCSN